MDDAGLTNIEHYPVLIIAASPPKEPTPALIGRVTDRLHQIGRQYRHFWIDTSRSNDVEQQYTHDLPILYGVVIKYTVVTFVTYDVAMPQRSLRYLAQFDFAQRGQDVWNCLAAAILVVRARNYLRELQAEGQLGREIKKGVVDEDAWTAKSLGKRWSTNAIVRRDECLCEVWSFALAAIHLLSSVCLRQSASVLTAFFYFVRSFWEYPLTFFSPWSKAMCAYRIWRIHIERKNGCHIYLVMYLGYIRNPLASKGRRGDLSNIPLMNDANLWEHFVA